MARKLVSYLFIFSPLGWLAVGGPLVGQEMVQPLPAIEAGTIDRSGTNSQPLRPRTAVLNPDVLLPGRNEFPTPRRHFPHGRPPIPPPPDSYSNIPNFPGTAPEVYPRSQLRFPVDPETSDRPMPGPASGLGTVPHFPPGTAPGAVGTTPALPAARPQGRLSSYKDGFFQRFEVSGTWLEGGTVNDIGLTEFKSLLTVAVPLPTKDHPLLISPNFETRLIRGPTGGLDLPGALYSGYAQFMWVPKLSDRWMGIFGIEPGFYGDFQSGDADNFRLLGRALFRFEYLPDKLEFIAGVLYLDRDDVNILPAGGIIWSPNDDMRYELLFPRPKLAHRTYFDGNVEYWVYLGGEFGGDSWAIQRASGAEDRLILRDVRVLLGLERKVDGGGGGAVEVGYVFNRVIDIGSRAQDIELGNTFLLRGVLRF